MLGSSQLFFDRSDIAALSIDDQHIAWSMKSRAT
jgi:hypothetical protein